MTATLSVIAVDASAEGAPMVVIGSDAGCTIGRSVDADVLVDDVQVSRNHLIIEPHADTLADPRRQLERQLARRCPDQPGRDRHPVQQHAARAARGAGRARSRDQAQARVVERAPAGHRRSAGVADGAAAPPGVGGSPRPPGSRRTPDAGRAQATLGPSPRLRGDARSGEMPTNDIHLPDLLVSRSSRRGPRQRRHRAEIVDLQSANGTFVNGQRVTQAAIYDGDVITIGHYLLQVEDSALVEFVDTGDVSFEAQGLSVFAGEKQLMHDVSFRLPARSLLAVVGPSGAGKSTLLNALTGFRPADVGNVRYAGRDLYASYDELRRRIGYVPQEDLLHTSLSVRKALEYGAELRFPPDVTAAERAARVDEVLGRARPDPARRHPGRPAVRRPAQTDQRRARAADQAVAAVPGRADLRARPGPGQVGDAVVAHARRRRAHRRGRHAQRRQPRRLRPRPDARARRIRRLLRSAARARWPTSARPTSPTCSWRWKPRPGAEWGEQFRTSNLYRAAAAGGAALPAGARGAAEHPPAAGRSGSCPRWCAATCGSSCPTGRISG